jgi:pimeloyl-ACP methyl ester carboxylesterase
MGIGRSAAVLAVAVPLVAGCAVATASPPALEWSACTVPDASPEMECSSIEVPVDWDDPAGRKITLDLARARATGADREGAVVANAGGPGIAGIKFFGRSLHHFAGLRERMDLVTWNPRGGDGRHPPKAECMAGPVFTTPENESEYEAAAAAGAEAMRPCMAADPALFVNMDAATQARDMDAIRAALGEEQLNYFGNSYGGVLGASYARLFPERVRTMYLDSIVDHVSSLPALNRIQYRAVEQMLERFGHWCRSTPECPLHGRDIEQVWQELIATAEREPIPIVGSDPPLALDGDDLKFWANGFVLHAEWPQFAAAIESALAGNAAPFDWMGSGGVAVFAAAALATQCADGRRFDGYPEYAEARRDNAEVSPNFAGERENYAATCAGWTTPVANPPGPLPSSQLPPFLGAGPVVEYGQVRAVVDQVPGSVTIRFDDIGHGLYLNEGNRCVIGHADRYLTDRVLPPPDTVCPPNPQ